MVDLFSILLIAAIIILLFRLTPNLPDSPLLKKLQGKNFTMPNFELFKRKK